MKIKRRILLKSTCIALASNIPLCLSGQMFASENLGSNRMVLYDKNYTLADKLAQKYIDEKVEVILIGSDVTDFWINMLKEKTQRELIEIVGVTTESLFVCLQQLLERENLINYEVSRINRDLFVWKIYSNPKNNNWRQVV